MLSSPKWGLAFSLSFQPSKRCQMHHSELQKGETMTGGWWLTAIVAVDDAAVCSLRNRPVTGRLGARSESSQPFWSGGSWAVPGLCPAWTPCPAASTDGLKESLSCGNKPKASTWGLSGWHHGGTNSVFPSPDCSPATTQAQAFLQIFKEKNIFKGIKITCSAVDTLLLSGQMNLLT